MDLIVRKANKADFKQIILLNVREYWDGIDQWKRDNEYERWKKGSWWCDTTLLNWHWNILKKNNGGILVITKENKIIGELDYVESLCNNFNLNVKRFHIIWLLIDTRYRRMGYAKKLIDELRLIANKSQIWVEPEDERTEQLYNKEGKIINYYSNWRIKRIKPGKIIKKFNSYNSNLNLIEKILSQINEYRAIFGNYYTCEFDLNQLLFCDPVKLYIWGDVKNPQIKVFNFGKNEYIAILSQYPRIYLKGELLTSDLELVITEVCRDGFNLGYDYIEFQFYYDESIISILKALNFECIILKDSIFNLN